LTTVTGAHRDVTELKIYFETHLRILNYFVSALMTMLL
jgi:hypothetical protein